MIRSSGYYAVLDGQQSYVSALAKDYAMVATPAGPVRHERVDLDDLLKVATTATWRGGRVSLTTVDSEVAGFFTNDRRLADAESLHGDSYNGWDGVAPLSELTDVSERVSSIHPRRNAQ